ncbi:N-acetylmuramoyl-L-alanine amidase family protein [Lacrimispora sp. 210928-DFI.3.58]|uniref:N-acetylmuramoyl-L-alanine amidase family protein n=1 Tax=Lacrimispora sp. 210928-DFI.3.58 TaxID=2883214 RepID=UPI001D08D49C|nr:N-acetylmuramoyl-L-alanine amidase family protein [Lacrimispora sp. 210928-DFI.3.58]MCB7320447.1 N-acetylmuramoyl-L-alanine amidase family protein [Lacrimispora sp. 210928-DFI.3.58]
MRGKKFASLSLAVIMAVTAAFPAFAADTKINTVKLTFRYDKAPASGDDIGDITVTAGGSTYTVESAEYTNADDKDTWTVGDVPEVKVELSAEDGYKFSYTTKSHFSLSGCSAEFEKAKIYDSGSTIEVYAQLKRVGGKLESASGIEWEDSTARWDEIEGAKSYDVKLLRDEKTVTTVNTTGTSFNFAGYFNKEGDYTFRVRAISSYNNKAGEWSDDSDTFTVSEDEIGTYSGSGRWTQDGNGWWYAYDTGGYPAGCWKQIDGAWYHFDASGYRQTGWQRVDGKWYYLHINGVMLTGWQFINNQWYYMNGSGEMQTGWQAVNGKWYYMNSSGVMLTGWQQVGNQWYYLDASGAMTTGWQAVDGKWYYLGTNGAMYANTWTPDGRYVDGNGVWTQ